MLDAANLAYGASPERLYIIRDSTIVYQGGPGPMSYSTHEVRVWLENYAAKRRSRWKNTRDIIMNWMESHTVKLRWNHVPFPWAFRGCARLTAVFWKKKLEKELNTMLPVLPPTFKPVLQQIRFLRVAWILTFDWIKLGGSHVIHRTCCKTSFSWPVKSATYTDFVAKSRISL